MLNIKSFRGLRPLDPRQGFHGYCTVSEPQPCDYCTRAVRMYNLLTICFWPPCPPKVVRLLYDHAWPSHNVRAGIVRCHLRHVYGLPSTVLRFKKNCLTPLETKSQSLRSPSNRTNIAQSPHEGLAEAARKGGYDQFTVSVDTSQAKCELGLRQVNVKNSKQLCVHLVPTSRLFTRADSRRSSTSSACKQMSCN